MAQFFRTNSRYPKFATALKISGAFSVGLFLFAGTSIGLGFTEAPSENATASTYFIFALVQAGGLARADEAADYTGDTIASIYEGMGDVYNYVTSCCRRN